MPSTINPKVPENKLIKFSQVWEKTNTKNSKKFSYSKCVPSHPTAWSGGTSCPLTKCSSVTICTADIIWARIINKSPKK